MSDKEAPNSMHSISGALQGLTIGVLLVFVALAHIDFGSYHIGFILLPVAIIYMWPSYASYSWSLFCVFLLGIFHDLASDGPLGLWALSYLLLFLVMGSGIGQRMSFVRAISGFAISLFFVAVLSAGIGFLSLGHFPNLASLMVSLLTSLMFFPILFWLRNLLGTTNDDLYLTRRS